jgi:chromatin segregation and condensation protein Rec8/ScpA/Scc1 (kleisin family)
LLELYKAEAVVLTQAERFGDIGARWTGAVALEVVLATADDYALAELSEP